MAATAREQELTAQVKELKEALKGNHEHSWYQNQIAERDRRIEELFDSVKATEEIKRNTEIERLVVENDLNVAMENKLKEYNQSEFTRFRLTDTPIKLDIFGTPDTPVFDLGVDLNFYDGPVYVPVAVVIEMAQSIGMQTAEQIAELKANLSLAEKKIRKAVELTKELTNVTIQSIADEFSSGIDSITADSANSDSEQSEADSGNAIDLAKTGGQASGDNSDENSNGVPDGSSNELDANSISDATGDLEFPK